MAQEGIHTRPSEELNKRSVNEFYATNFNSRITNDATMRFLKNKKPSVANDIDVLKQKILVLNEWTNELTRTELADRIEEIATFVKEME